MTKYPGWRLAYSDESRTPTLGSPASLASFARLVAAGCPAEVGYDARINVQASRPAGHSTSSPRCGACGRAGVVLGAVGVVRGVGSVGTVSDTTGGGSVAGRNGGALVVATSASSGEASVSRATRPAATARIAATRATSTGQAQGCPAGTTRAIPVRGSGLSSNGRRWPHSRQ